MASVSKNEMSCTVQEEEENERSNSFADQGAISLECNFIGELGLKEHFTGCKKNPDHADFIPFSSLTVNHFPILFRTQAMLKWVLSIGKLTAKVTVRFVSPARPRQCPLNSYKGTFTTTTGTGFVTECTDILAKMECPFGNICQEIKKLFPHTVCGYFRLTTAAHVVFDDEEAKNTELTFFFDDDRMNKGFTMKARAVRVITRCVEGDWSELECVTHDKRLRRKLIKALEEHSDYLNINKYSDVLRRFKQSFTLLLHSENHRLPGYILKKYLEDRQNPKKLIPSPEHFIETDIYSSMLDGVDLLYSLSHESLPSPINEEVKHVLSFFRSCDLQFWTEIDGQPKVPRAELNLNTFNSSMSKLISYFYDKHKEEYFSMAVVISHPHGQAKHITFGKQLVPMTDTGFYSYTYTAPTCNGSSGAPVWMFNIEDDNRIQISGTPHSRHFENDINRSSSYTFY